MHVCASLRPLLTKLANSLCLLELGLPTSVDFVRHELRQMVVSYNTAQTLVYDIETCKVVTKLDSAKSYGKWYLCVCVRGECGVPLGGGGGGGWP